MTTREDRIYFPKKTGLKKIKNLAVGKAGERVRNAPPVKGKKVKDLSTTKVSTVKVTPAEVRQYIANPAKFKGSSEDFLEALEAGADKIMEDQAKIDKERLDRIEREKAEREAPKVEPLRIEEGRRGRPIGKTPLVPLASGAMSAVGEGMTARELKEALKERGVKGMSGKKKEDLVKAYAEVVDSEMREPAPLAIEDFHEEAPVSPKKKGKKAKKAEAFAEIEFAEDPAIAELEDHLQELSAIDVEPQAEAQKRAVINELNTRIRDMKRADAERERDELHRPQREVEELTARQEAEYKEQQRQRLADIQSGREEIEKRNASKREMEEHAREREEAMRKYDLQQRADVAFGNLAREQAEDLNPYSEYQRGKRDVKRQVLPSFESNIGREAPSQEEDLSYESKYQQGRRDIQHQMAKIYTPYQVSRDYPDKQFEEDRASRRITNVPRNVVDKMKPENRESNPYREVEMSGEAPYTPHVEPPMDTGSGLNIDRIHGRGFFSSLLSHGKKAIEFAKKAKEVYDTGKKVYNETPALQSAVKGIYASSPAIQNAVQSIAQKVSGGGYYATRGVGRPSKEMYEVSHGINSHNHLKKFIKLSQKEQAGHYLGAKSAKALNEYKKINGAGFFDSLWSGIKKGVGLVGDNMDTIKQVYGKKDEILGHVNTARKLLGV